MLHFVIYEDKAEHRKAYKDIIFSIFGTKNDDYKITEIDRYTKSTIELLDSLDGEKIFILDVEVPGKSGLDLARYIRKDMHDWESQLIVVTYHQQFRDTSFTSRLLMLDFVSKQYNCSKHLRESLVDAVKILSKSNCLCYVKKNKYRRIKYNTILYVEKAIDDMQSIIVGKNTKEVIDLPINKVCEQLMSDVSFFKTSRNCIINLFNVTDVDFNNRIIRFEEIEIKSLARDRKKELKQRLTEIGK